MRELKLMSGAMTTPTTWCRTLPRVRELKHHREQTEEASAHGRTLPRVRELKQEGD